MLGSSGAGRRLIVQWPKGQEAGKDSEDEPGPAGPETGSGVASCKAPPVRPRGCIAARPARFGDEELPVDIMDFWGKAQPRNTDQGPQWHPLVFHSLDVAAVSAALLARHPALADHLSGLLGLSQEDTLSLVPFLISVHDIGKFAKLFQAKVPCRFPPCFDDDLSGLATSYDHGAGGLRLFDADASLFALPDGSRSRIWRPLISAVTGHHGAPPLARADESLRVLRADFGVPGLDAAGAFMRRMGEVLETPAQLPPLKRKQVRPASYALAGLCVLADWIGSNQVWFPYRASREFESLEAYWTLSQQQADRAIVEAGVLPAGVRSYIEHDALIGAGVVPTPMQEWARSVALPAGPALFAIEDETGSGKTEAALALAHRLMAAGRAEGLYIALPTMATANAMFERLGAACRALFAPDGDPSVALVHGARDMHRRFRRASLPGGPAEPPYERADGAEAAAETTATTACAEWIADDRRKAFLADAGAGTVDQALLSILPSRHQSLRLLGLMRRVLILDEVHAYDSYMQREIDALLEFQAGLGGSAIVLSATLPAAVRRRLASAFVQGLGEFDDPADMGEDSSDFPLATVRAVGVRQSTGVQPQPGRGRVLPLCFLRTSEEALREVEEASRTGRAVLYVRNTVDDALEAHAALSPCDPAPLLFHARFALVDRLKREREVLQTFGKASTIEARRGRVLIATQVVEQSLDLDFDAAITDLAPIDLVIQRAGRLWRHERRTRTGRPTFSVVGPEPSRDAGQDWFSRAFPRAAYVYRDHARLWLTARALENAGAIESPDGLRALVEAVYGDGVEDCVPEGLQGIYFEAEGRAKAERSVAGLNVLSLGQGYVRDAGAWDDDARTPTRNADDPQVTLRLARVRGGCVEPYALADAPDEAWRAWRLSEVSVSERRVGGAAIAPQHCRAADVARSEWTRFDGDKVLVLLKESEAPGAPLVGRVRSGDGAKEVVLGYDSLRGLTWQ